LLAGGVHQAEFFQVQTGDGGQKLIEAAHENDTDDSPNGIESRYAYPCST
jgi:hypothetical protein